MWLMQRLVAAVVNRLRVSHISCASVTQSPAKLPAFAGNFSSQGNFRVASITVINAFIHYALIK